MNDENYFNITIKLAEKAKKSGNVPVGAIIVYNNKIIAKAYNKKNSKHISIYHAEILAIISACKKFNSFILSDCIMYVSLEPCELCMNAIAESRIRKVKFLISSNYFKNLNSNYLNIKKQIGNYSYLQDKYKIMLSSFFKNKR